MNQNKKIRLYTIPNCKYCVEMKEGLKKRNIQFTEIDVSLSKNDKEFKDVVKISKTESVPTVIVGKNLLAPDVNFWSIEQGLGLIEKILNE